MFSTKHKALRLRFISFALALLTWPMLANAQPRTQPSTQLSTQLSVEQIRAATADIDSSTIAQPAKGDWLSYGRDYREQRFSPLQAINDANVNELGLAWSFDTDYNRGLETTPIVVDGVMYVTGNWSIVYALDAKTGQQLWKYDPQVDKAWGKMACCDVVNRGVALYQGKVVFGTLDARLVALDAATGEKLWSVQTADISLYPYTITGAPRIAKGKVFIGNGGAEYGVRGFVSAYDVDNGELMWRFYTVPGNPADGKGDSTELMASKTWTGQWWNYGGGGTVWDSIVYDDELDQLYIGVGNGSPWNRRIRSPEGGDNLFLSSIVALNPDSGQYLWHYQETPAETWDYTATQHIMLADMNWQGEAKKVIWHAPKNGFFFIIDRTNGQLLSAEPYAKVTWASHYDLSTGRPVETANADYSEGSQLVHPSSGGAHNWQPMAHHPDTGLVYIPAMEMPFNFQEVEDYVHQWGQFNVGAELFQDVIDNDLLQQALVPKLARGHLLAWDPATQSEAWRAPRKLAWNGGLLATAGNLLFQGLAESAVVAMAADTGKELWRFDSQTGVIGSPVAYSVDGEQYIAIAAGFGGAMSLMEGVEPGQFPQKSRILSFKLQGQARLPALPALPVRNQPPATISDDTQLLAEGGRLYATYCTVCHGLEAVSNGRVPDLRHLPAVFYDNFDAIVLDGVMSKMGMVGFSDVLSEQDALAIKAYLLQQANEDWQLSQQSSTWLAIKRWFYDLLAKLVAWWLAL